MLPALAFFSAIQAICNNTDYYSNSAPNLVDVSAWRVISIVASYGMDINDNKVPTFQYLYQELKKKVNSIIQFPRPDWNGDATIANLYTWLQANCPNMQLSYYTKLICIDKINAQSQNISGDYSDVLLNDTMVMRREYDPNWIQPNADPVNPVITPATHLYLYQGNENDYKVYTCLGDQTIAGNQYSYYYGEYGGFY